MKIIEKKVKDSFFSYPSFDTFFDDISYGVFDIETTGLSPKTSQLILSGFYLPLSNGEFIYKQFFAESLDEEPLVILETLKVLETLDCVITYNGASFDMPFLTKRMKHFELPEFNMPYNLDMYKIIRNYSDIKKFTPNLKQKTIELFLGIGDKRIDEIDGAASVYAYFDYLANPNPNDLEIILLHNRDDVLQLYKILGIINKTDFYRAICIEGFPLQGNIVEKIKLSKSKLQISGRFWGNNSFCNFADQQGIVYDFNSVTREFQVYLKLQQIKDVIFADIDDLNLQSQLLETSEGYFEGNLMLSNKMNVNYQGVSTLAKVLIERIVNDEL
ncbi:MAG: ribonuclease H-like domain-containing protein [Anaerovoracaceae bacterium]